MNWTVRWVGWGSGKFHLQRVGETSTVCGREIPAGRLRGAVYMPSSCARCRSFEDEHQAAEQYRRALLDGVEVERNERLARNRAGVFTVLRCELCGEQHARRASRDGVPFCMGSGHVAELEEIEATGAVWGAPKEQNDG